MRLPIYILIAFIPASLWGFSTLINPVSVTGHLRTNLKDSPVYINNISVFVKGDNKILASTISDEKGNFELTFTAGKEQSFDFFCYGPGVDTILIASLKNFESDSPDIIFYIPGERKRNAAGKTICPKCKKTDMVYKVVYSDGMPDHFNGDKNIDTLHKNPHVIDGVFYAGTCVAGVAKYYCDRDKVKF